MTVRMSTPFRELSSADLKRESQVLFDKVIPPVIVPPGPCSPAQYVVAETVSDDFNRANGPGFQLPGVWREIQNTIVPPRNSVAINVNELIERYDNPPLSSCVGGIRLDIPSSSNWRVKAIWGTQDVRLAGSNGPRMYLCAPISQQIPGDPAPPINAVNYFTWMCQRTTTVAPITYQFQLFSVAGYPNALTALGASFSTSAFRAGSEYSLEVFCNNVTIGPASTIVRGLVDGVIRASVAIVPGNLPAGLPGCGIMFDQALGTPANVASLNSWTAERLV